VGLVVVVVLLVCGVGSYVTWTAGRLDRLTARVDAAWNALDAQLVRRAAVATELAAHLRRHRMVPEERAKSLQYAAVAVRNAEPPDREEHENDLGREIRLLLDEMAGRGGKAEALADELRAAGMRVQLARQFYNDAVRDNRARRRRLLPRLLTIRHRDQPRREFFEIDDSTEPAQGETSRVRA
jgi:hypothetical protein